MGVSLLKLGRYLGIRSSDAAFFALLLSISLSVNIGMAWEIRFLKLEIPDSQRAAITGAIVSPFLATSVDGRPQLITFQDRDTSTVLYIFNPNCGWCARNLQNIRALSASAQIKDRFIGISLKDASLSQYVENSDLGFPVFSIDSYDSIKGLHLGATPQTLVISPQGKVTQNWPGAYMGAQQKEIEGFFNVKLPGLSPAQPESK
ncbi:MAG TPA: hypothetical protein VGR81_09290 [Candidatus Acidoferrales bacterium]|nr:hypothetical protein [Candidatus Acidoferrales bacterium]